MKNRNLNLIFILLGWCCFAGVAQADNLSNIVDQNRLTSAALVAAKTKPANQGPEYKPDPQVILQGGDTFATATIIPSIPYSNIGTTIGYTNNYQATCPYPSGDGPDVVYRFTPSSNIFIDISLCANSDYDTKLYVHANSYVNGAHIACNDDICSTPSYPAPYVSRVTGVALTFGNTYYITVDGYGNAAGNYTIDIYESDSCIVNCPPGGLPEAELDCGPGYVDTYNGGCNSPMPAFQGINCGDTICGTSGVYQFAPGLIYRDTDWFEMEVTQECDLTWSGVGEFGVSVVIIDAGSRDCTDYSILSYESSNIPCDTVFTSYHVVPGIYWLWIGPSDWNMGWGCPVDYVAWATGDCCGIEPCCDVNMVPDNYSISVPPGGSFGLTGYVSNPTPNPIITDVWVGVIYQNLFYQLWDFPNIALNPQQIVSAHLNQYVPGYAPAGSYDYVAYCGDYPDNICDSVRFDFSVTGGRINGGADEWALEGGFEAADIPSEYALKSSHPNPFNATTTITFDVPMEGNLNLEVFNLMGQKVATLIDGNIEAGQHSVTWDAANYSSGLYFYKMTAGERVFTKRMTLLK